MNVKVLIVDDNPINLKLACNVLRTAGFEIITAIDAEDTLHNLEKITPDIILMDIELPGMDGLTLTKLLKENDKTKHIPVVALTSYAMKGDQEKAFQSGCIGYITKPIDTRIFPSQVTGFLGNVRYD
ncbi:putative polar-differentiation response regulator DivK [Leptospira broomii serovar Hurstbridge str. 5399]|uniref:Polar-differentiation response regulator DivK n=1 Tax=Leptospira broomii serovar Hurstbridge str. 5399 TaxID=1049789 RepID=T0GLX5_9LEPT|nr:response regulator [Leptospira broomii]EQA46368.1 putative polar-differentiation response regulator DivK [Leptospira broomii serovar Hurstbridge str. 5399]